MQGQDLRLGTGHAFLHSHFFETIHEFGDFNIIRTARGACFARGTYPDRMTTQYGLRLPDNYQANHFVWIKIHGKGDRAAVGALATLITCACQIGSDSFDLF